MMMLMFTQLSLVIMLPAMATSTKEWISSRASEHQNLQLPPPVQFAAHPPPAASSVTNKKLKNNNFQPGRNTRNKILIDDILTNITTFGKPTVRPVENPSDVLTVHISSALYQLVDLDQRNNLATISAYFEITWLDASINWNKEDYGNTTLAYVPAGSVWIPELYLYHSVEGSTPLTFADSAVQVDNTGNIRAFVPFTARALCPINVKHFPFDKQTCEFKFGSWSYINTALEYRVKHTAVYLDDFFDNQEWTLLKSSLRSDKIVYNTDSGTESYAIVVMRLELERQSFYYIFNLVCPVTLVSIVAVVGFHMPMFGYGFRTAKFRLGIMTLLSMGVMLLMLVDDMPKFAMKSIEGKRGSFSAVPLLGIFYLILISNISLTTCVVELFVIMEGYAVRNPKRSQVPRIIRWLDFKWSSLIGQPSVGKLRRDQCADSVLRKVDHYESSELQSLTTTATTNGSAGKGIFISDAVPPARSAPLEQVMQGVRQTLESIQTTMSMIEEDIRMKTLPTHWDTIIYRLECVSMFWSLGVIVLDVALLYYGQWIY